MAMGLTELLVVGAIAVAVFALVPFWLWMLRDCWQAEPEEGWARLAWAAVVAVGGPLGAAVYFVVRRPRRIAEEVGRQQTSAE